MIKEYRNKITSIGLVFSLLIISLGFSCNGNDKLKTLAKAADDSAQAQISIVKLVATAKANGELSSEAVAKIKVVLTHLNSTTDVVIQKSKLWVNTPMP